MRMDWTDKRAGLGAEIPVVVDELAFRTAVVAARRKDLTLDTIEAVVGMWTLQSAIGLAHTLLLTPVAKLSGFEIVHWSFCSHLG